MAGPSDTGNLRIRGFLKRVIGDYPHSIIPLVKFEYTVGRDPRCGIFLDDVNISRKHCVIKLTINGWMLTDYGGINGTYLNGNKIPSEIPTPLKDGMVIFLGDPAITNFAFVFLKTLPDGSPSTSEISSSSTLPRSACPFETSPHRCQIKREAGSPIRVADGLKRVKRYNAFTSTSNNAQPSAAVQTTTEPSLYENCYFPLFTSDVVNRLPSIARAEPIAGPSIVADTHKCLPRQKALGLEVKNMPIVTVVRAPVSDAEVVDDPYKLSSDGDGASDCSISSLDSLKTRIRKKQRRESRKFSQSNCSEAGPSSKELPKVVDAGECLLQLDGSEELVDLEKAAVAKRKKGKKDLQLEELESTSTTQQDSDSDASESLLPVRHPDEACSQTKHAEETSKDSSEKAQATEQEVTIMYLKERVLKLQQNLSEANSELKNISEESRKQKNLIEVLKSSQGISQEQLMKVLEDEISCNICTEILIKPVTLRCSHTFCDHCITTWKKKKKQCPMCREVITLEMGIKVLDNLINKAVEHLDESYQTRRLELIQSRVEEKAEKLKKRKKARARRSQIRFQRIPNSLTVTSPNPVEPSVHFTGYGRIEVVPIDVLNVNSMNPYPSGIEIQISDGSDTSVRGSGYYGGFGRCRHCGRRDHWSNGCPTLNL